MLASIDLISRSTTKITKGYPLLFCPIFKFKKWGKYSKIVQTPKAKRVTKWDQRPVQGFLPDENTFHNRLFGMVIFQSSKTDIERIYHKICIFDCIIARATLAASPYGLVLIQFLPLTQLPCIPYCVSWSLHHRDFPIRARATRFKSLLLSCGDHKIRKKPVWLRTGLKAPYKLIGTELNYQNQY